MHLGRTALAETRCWFFSPPRRARQIFRVCCRLVPTLAVGEPSVDNLPGAVVKVGVPRGPGAVEGERELLVVLVLLTPHPEGGEHFDLNTGNHVSLWSTLQFQSSPSWPREPQPTAARSRGGDGGEAGGCGQRHVERGALHRLTLRYSPLASMPRPAF